MSTAAWSQVARLFNLLALVGALAAALAAAGPAAAAEKGLTPDVTWGTTDEVQDKTIQAIVDSGATWARLDANWRWIDSDPWALQHLDRAIERTHAAGLDIVVAVVTTPEWASGSPLKLMPPKDPGTFANFVGFLANRYRGKVDGWEIWNEPNHPRFWPTLTGPDAAEYVKLLKASYPAVKQADPDAKVVFGGLSTNDYPYLERAYAAEPNLGDYFDVMAVHPYPYLGAEPEKLWSEPGSDRISPYTFAGYREVRATMLAKGDREPIWITEFGWATTTQITWCGGVDEATQADYVRRSFKLLEEDPYVEKAAWYNLRNNFWAGDIDTWEDQLGLLRTDFSPKPAWQAFVDYRPPAPPAPLPAPIQEPVNEVIRVIDEVVDTVPTDQGQPPEREVPPPTAAPVAPLGSDTAPRRLSLRLRRGLRSRPPFRLIVTGRAPQGSAVRITVRRRGGGRAVRRLVNLRRSHSFRVTLRLTRGGRWNVSAQVGPHTKRATIRLR